VGPLRSSILSLIDLAGSENAKLTNATGGRQREGKQGRKEGRKHATRCVHLTLF
jgi:hypothetical protein